MTTRHIAGAALVATVVITVLVLAAGGGDQPYSVRLALDNASGLRTGSDVTIGGVKAGTVSVHLGAHDNVVADLKLDRSQAPVGKDASAAITAVNFLGRKRVELDKGNTGDPAPSGFVIAPARVTTSTDLDQVLDVLDANTRARLTILINEAGRALGGRRADVSRLLAELPHSMARATALLGALVSDNHTLAHLLTGSDRFIAQIARERKGLARMIDVAGQTGTTVSARRADLRRTLAQAPGTLATLQRFLNDLRATTVPLGPAARDIAATAPALSATLAQVDGFRRAAEPALAEATEVAPQLTRLALGATPVLRRATPAAGALADFGAALPPLSRALDHSTDNILAVVENWARAIQFRDGLSHVFRGEASMTPDALRSIVDRLTRKATRPRASRPAARSEHSPATPRELPTLHAPRLDETLDGVGKGVSDAVRGVTRRLLAPKPPASRNDDQAGTRRLLDYLLAP